MERFRAREDPWRRIEGTYQLHYRSAQVPIVPPTSIVLTGTRKTALVSVSPPGGG
jgi:hypothetical protein